jgi:hypothetical protein
MVVEETIKDRITTRTAITARQARPKKAAAKTPETRFGGFFVSSVLREESRCLAAVWGRRREGREEMPQAGLERNNTQLLCIY